MLDCEPLMKINTLPQFEQAIEYAHHRLRTELSPALTYHSYWHTFSDVMPAAARLANLNQISDMDKRLVGVAAAFHDIGYIHDFDEHEAASVEVVNQVLPRFGFTPAQVDQIAGMILATHLPQSPRNLLEEILADADLDVLGREDFLERGEHLRQELIALGKLNPTEQWNQRQLDFLRQHRYFTPQAIALRQAAKLSYIAAIEEMLRKNGKA